MLFTPKVYLLFFVHFEVKNLFDFPCVETNTPIELEGLLLTVKWCKLFKNKKPIITSVSKLYKHHLSHQTVYARFIEVSLKSAFSDEVFTKVMRKEVHTYAIPRLVEKYLLSRNDF